MTFTKTLLLLLSLWSTSIEASFSQRCIKIFKQEASVGVVSLGVSGLSGCVLFNVYDTKKNIASMKSDITTIRSDIKEALSKKEEAQQAKESSQDRMFRSVGTSFIPIIGVVDHRKFDDLFSGNFFERFINEEVDKFGIGTRKNFLWELEEAEEAREKAAECEAKLSRLSDELLFLENNLEDEEEDQTLLKSYGCSAGVSCMVAFMLYKTRAYPMPRLIKKATLFSSGLLMVLDGHYTLEARWNHPTLQDFDKRYNLLEDIEGDVTPMANSYKKALKASKKLFKEYELYDNLSFHATLMGYGLYLGVVAFCL